RIVAVADTYDAITTDRPYQKGASYEQGHEILRKIAGKRLEPELVEAFVSAWHRYRKGPTTKQVAAAPPPESHETCKIDKETQQAALEAAAAARAAMTEGGTSPADDGPQGPDDDGPDLGEKLREIILIG